MKKGLLFTAILLLLAVGAQAQSDTIYFMKKGMVVNKQSIKTTDVDTIVFYKPAFPFTDARDGYVYKTVRIGDQIWMAENLRYLPSVSVTASETDPSYYVYGYTGIELEVAKANENYKAYGALYNVPAALTACPNGWHLPTLTEWDDLIDALGGTSAAGPKLKEVGDAHWESPNAGATNESGFTALPAGGYNGTRFAEININAAFWIEPLPAPETKGRARVLTATSELFSLLPAKKAAFSVRCVQD